VAIELIYLDREALVSAGLLDFARAVEDVESVFKMLAAGEVVMPPKVAIELFFDDGSPKGHLVAMPVYVKPLGVAGVKWACRLLPEPRARLAPRPRRDRAQRPGDRQAPRRDGGSAGHGREDGCCGGGWGEVPSPGRHRDRRADRRRRGGESCRARSAGRAPRPGRAEGVRPEARESGGRREGGWRQGRRGPRGGP
jgi:hypothetical protein